MFRTNCDTMVLWLVDPSASGGDRRLRRREVVGCRGTGRGFRGSQPVRRQLPRLRIASVDGRRNQDVDRDGFCCHRSRRVNRVCRHRAGRRRRRPRRAADRPGARRRTEDRAIQDAAPCVDLHRIVHLGSGRPAQRSPGHDTLATCSATCPRLPGCVGPARCDLRSRRASSTSAGVSAGIDLALALVEDDYGTELVRDVARSLVVYLKRAGGQSQFSVLVEADPPPQSALRAVTDAIAADRAATTAVKALPRWHR